MKIAIVDSGVGLVSLLKRSLKRKVKQEIHLRFTSLFPLGQYGENDIRAEAVRLEKKIEEEQYDLVFIMCNTLSCFMKDGAKNLKILNLNKEYLLQHPQALPVGTASTIKTLKKGYADVNLAGDIENDNPEGIIKDIVSWPDAEEYLLCCTHYALIQDLVKKIKRPAKVVDLTDKMVDILCSLPAGRQLTIDYGGKGKQIKRYLKF